MQTRKGLLIQVSVHYSSNPVWDLLGFFMYIFIHIYLTFDTELIVKL